MSAQWEDVDNVTTTRLKVDSGYLYRTRMFQTEGMAMCFVPDVDLQRYQAHLRDAYKQGYEAGHADAKVGIHAEI